MRMSSINLTVCRSAEYKWFISLYMAEINTSSKPFCLLTPTYMHTIDLYCMYVATVFYIFKIMNNKNNSPKQVEDINNLIVLQTLLKISRFVATNQSENNFRLRIQNCITTLLFQKNFLTYKFICSTIFPTYFFAPTELISRTLRLFFRTYFAYHVFCFSLCYFSFLRVFSYFVLG